MTFPRWIMPVVAVMGVSGIGYYFYTHRAHNPAAVPTPEKPDAQIELRFHHVDLQGRKDGVATWTIHAKQVDVSRDQRFAYLKQNPEGTFFNLKDWNPKEGEARTRSFDWTGREAEYDTVSNNLTIQGNVRIKTDANEVLETDRVEYVSEGDKVHLPGAMTLTGEKGKPKIKADKADADLKLEVLDLQGHVKIDTLIGESQQIK